MQLTRTHNGLATVAKDRVISENIYVGWAHFCNWTIFKIYSRQKLEIVHLKSSPLPLCLPKMSDVGTSSKLECQDNMVRSQISDTWTSLAREFVTFWLTLKSDYARYFCSFIGTTLLFHSVPAHTNRTTLERGKYIADKQMEKSPNFSIFSQEPVIKKNPSLPSECFIMFELLKKLIRSIKSRFIGIFLIIGRIIHIDIRHPQMISLKHLSAKLSKVTRELSTNYLWNNSYPTPLLLLR